MTPSLALWWRGALGAALCVVSFLAAAAGFASDSVGAWAVGTVSSIGAGVMLWWASGLLARERATLTRIGAAIDRVQRAAGAEPEPGPATDVPAVEHRLRLAEGALVSRIDDSAASSGDLRALLDAIDYAIIAFDAAGLVRATNRAADAFFERSPGQLTGHSIEELFSQADLIALYSDAARGTPGKGLVRIPRAGEVRTYQVLAIPLEMTIDAADTRPRGRAVAVTLEDVTEFAASVQHKTEFVANASHELRTPLSSIRAASETLLDAAHDPAMVHRLVSMISTNARRLEELVSDLADLSRLESPESAVVRAPANLRELCASVGSLFDRVCVERSLTLDFQIVPEVERVETDARLLLLILKNLVENATKFANESTSVVVEATPLPGSPRPGLRLRVTDQGIGIPLAAQARIFERFYQVDPSRSGQAQRRGTGLGLAIVKHAVKTLGGTVSVSSVWKEGTTMTVELPDCVAPAIGGSPQPAFEAEALDHSPGSGA